MKIHGLILLWFGFNQTGWFGHIRRKTMHEYEYVTKEEYGPVKDELIDLIKALQNELRDYLTFQYTFVGSSSRNMITREANGNRGYDFDVDLKINHPEEYAPSELKHLITNALNRITFGYGYGFCEDSSRVITIKKVDHWYSRIISSCDFAIVHEFHDRNKKPHYLYVYFNKTKNEYRWQERSKEYTGLREKEEKIKQADLWNEVREIYLEKKCLYSDDKKSRTLYAETINEVFQLLENRGGK